MNITLRTKIFIVGGLIIGLILAVALSLYFFRDNNKGKNNVSNNAQETDKNSTTTTSPYINNNNPGPQNKIIEATKPTTVYTSDEIYVKQLATLFTERFNTYSNRADNANIEEALALATKEMTSFINSQKVRQEGEYAGMTTTVISSAVKTLSKDRARVEVGAEVVTFSGNTQDSKFRTASVELTRVDGEWKVSRYAWVD